MTRLSAKKNGPTYMGHNTLVAGYALTSFADAVFVSVLCAGFNECPGHLGHIELAVPVYNPTLFPELLK